MDSHNVKKILYKYESEYYSLAFELTTTKNRCKVVVKNIKGSSYIHRIYRFNNVEMFYSPYISWENVAHCDGYPLEKSTYLLTAVQQGKKLCAGIFFSNAVSMEKYINENINDDYLICKHELSYDHNEGSCYNLDVVRKGCISDYFDMEDVFKAYKRQGISIYESPVLRNNLEKYINMPMIDLVGCNEGYNYVESNSIHEFIITGLLLGYPIESTASIIQGH